MHFRDGIQECIPYFRVCVPYLQWLFILVTFVCISRYYSSCNCFVLDYASFFNLMDVFSRAFIVVVLLGLLGEFCIKEEGKKECLKSPPDPQFIMAQYEEVYKSFHRHDNLIWQIPSVAVAINSGILIVGLRYFGRQPVFSILMVIAIVFTLALLYATIKHRYFSRIEERTLRAIEKECNLKLIQRTTKPEPGEVYWHKKTPAWHEILSAHEVLIFSLVIVTLLDLSLLLNVV
jgi:cadmium resistance protein CadD (predicted permease)